MEEKKYGICAACSTGRRNNDRCDSPSDMNRDLILLHYQPLPDTVNWKISIAEYNLGTKRVGHV